MKAALNETILSTALHPSEPAIIPALLRLPMSAMVAASALAGYLAFPGFPRATEAGLLTGAMFTLAAGCSALNQVQERIDDGRMIRTRQRPLPSGRLTAAPALVMSGALITLGLLLLNQLEYPIFGWGLGALLLYNGVYTGLKKRTPFALLAGALCGALPPLMGWCSAGGHSSDPRIVGLAGLMVLWQVPHTWSRCACYPEDNTTGPFTSLFRYLDVPRLERLHRLWCLALAIATLHLPASGLLQTSVAKGLCLALSAGLFIAPTWLNRAPATSSGPKKLTLYMAALICLVISDKFFG